MTTIAWLFMIPAATSFAWPIILLLFKRNVKVFQWLFVLTQVMVGCALLLYSHYFNTNIVDEYFLSMMYMVSALVGPYLFNIFVCELASPQGITNKERRLFAFPLFISIVIVSSVIIGGRENCHLFTSRVVMGSDLSLTTSTSYNIMLICSYYLFQAAFIVELVYVTLMSMSRFKSFHRMLEDYLGGQSKRINLSNWFITAFSIIVPVSLLIYALRPFNQITSPLMFAFMCIPAAIMQLFLGYYILRIPYTAQEIMSSQSDSDYSYGRVRRLASRAQEERYAMLNDAIVEVVESEMGYLDKSITLSSVAQRLLLSSSELSDVVRTVKGCSFTDYVDGLRIDKAISLLLFHSDAEPSAMRYKVTRTDYLESLADQCGYFSVESFKKSFKKVMGQTIEAWLANGMIR